MPVRPATEADFDDICALIGELADYERLAHEVAFDAGELRGHLFGDDPAASVLMATTDDGNGGRLRPVVPHVLDVRGQARHLAGGPLRAARNTGATGTARPSSQACAR